jgi:hypothetical protein
MDNGTHIGGMDLDEPQEIRPVTIQRDWLGHILQTLVILVAVGVPFAYWANSVTRDVATLSARADRMDRDMLEQRQFQTLITTQQLEASRTLTRIDTQLGDIKERLIPKR